ncbi:hypothetical protein QLQ15_13385 [Lysobacter sp. LF1]|uniref:DUF2845 domain-containing protein n=1 Tax=Lysobacter stagni TaxID=3045172 RepID=A0ABT6XIK7_9GAMM|nr:hypothetical protein [Lysobacter sp. LF1]MDI9239899.1 hypothetical protein [Lysobacter sp. LF1]
MPFTATQRIIVLACLASGLTFVRRAEAAVSCVTGLPTERIVQAWRQTGLNWDVAVNQPVNIAIVEYTYKLTKTGSTAEDVAFETHWGGQRQLATRRERNGVL